MLFISSFARVLLKISLWMRHSATVKREKENTQWKKHFLSLPPTKW
jgi:hypothetical protein